MIKVMPVQGEQIAVETLNAAWASLGERFSYADMDRALERQDVSARALAWGATSQFLQNQKRRGAVTFNRKTRQWVKSNNTGEGE